MVIMQAWAGAGVRREEGVGRAPQAGCPPLRPVLPTPIFSAGGTGCDGAEPRASLAPGRAEPHAVLRGRQLTRLSRARVSSIFPTTWNNLSR